MSIKYVKIEMEIDGLDIKDLKKLDCLKSWLHESTRFFITGKTMNIIKINASYGFNKARLIEQIRIEELVNKLKMCRNDLKEKTIRVEVQKIASESLITIKNVLYYCAMNAMEDKPMPWEEKGKTMKDKKETNKELNSELKYFYIGRTESGYGVTGICLADRLLSIAEENDKIIFREECDGRFYEVYTKEQAIELLQEAIEWIKK